MAENGFSDKIALLNFQPFHVSNISFSNEDKFIRYEVVSVDDLGKLTNYDFVLGFGMGLKVSEEQRNQIQSAADKGTPVYMFAVTNPENNICNLDSTDLKQISGYLENANKPNYQNMARYTRQNIEKKTFFVTDAQSVIESVADAMLSFI